MVVANDSPCGSTIGPMMSAKLGVRTVDIGGPTLSMHSIREMCCTTSVYQCSTLFKVEFNLHVINTICSSTVCQLRVMITIYAHGYFTLA